MKIEEAVKVLSSGGVVILPSDTCYMLAALATNKAAINKVLELKPALSGRPISVVMTDWKMALEYVQIDKGKLSLAKKLLPGSYTVVAKAKKKLAEGVMSSENTLGFRITTDKKLQEIVRQLGAPITATSAQVYGNKIPYSLGFLKKLSKKKMDLIDLVWDVGKLPARSLSTVVNLVGEEINISRREDFLKRFEKRIGQYKSTSEEETGLVAQKIWTKIKTAGKLMVIFLVGDLGGGKTTLVKKMAYEMGLVEVVNSPTFNLVNEYDLKNQKYKKLIHMDLYRLETVKDVEEIELERYVTKDNLLAIEWAERIPPWLMEKIVKNVDTFLIEIKYIDQNTREFVFKRLPATTSSPTPRRTAAKASKTTAGTFPKS